MQNAKSYPQRQGDQREILRFQFLGFSGTVAVRIVLMQSCFMTSTSCFWVWGIHKAGVLLCAKKYVLGTEGRRWHPLALPGQPSLDWFSWHRLAPSSVPQGVVPVLALGPFLRCPVLVFGGPALQGFCLAPPLPGKEAASYFGK